MNDDGSLDFDSAMISPTGFLGDTIAINGTIDPYLEATPTRSASAFSTPPTPASTTSDSTVTARSVSSVPTADSFHNPSSSTGY